LTVRAAGATALGTMHIPERLPVLRTSSRLRRVAGPVLAALFAVGALTIAPAPASAQTAAPMKLAVIDVRRAVLETEQGLRVQANLKREFERRQVELDGKQGQLRADMETFQKEMKAGKASKEALEKKRDNLLKQEAELQQVTLDAQREMQRKEQEATGPILAGIIEIVKRIAAQDGFEMVLEKSAVPYFRADLEVTDRAIQMYNSGQGARGPAKPAAPLPPPAAPKAPAPAPAPKK
jgi:outer membrane protein